MHLAAAAVIFRARAATRRAAQQRRARLEQDLSSFTSQADLNDLHAILDRYPDGISYELRDILAHQETVRRARRRWPGTAPG